jgi:DNA-binding CsgD family transcriptional regulator
MAGQLREGVFARPIDEAVGLVHRGLSVHLVGTHASGRSELLDLIADRLDDEGATILRLYGVPAWRQEPFAALSASGVGPTNAPAPRRSIGDMSSALAEHVRGGTTVVVVDDADELDLHTVGALVNVHHRERRLVAVTASRPHLPIRPDSLLLGLTPAVELAPPTLDLDEVDTMCRALLGGPIDAGALARIATQAGGLAGLVRAIASIGSDAGTLCLRDGVWTIPGDLWTPRLGSVVKRYLAGVDQGVQDGATRLAVTGPVPLAEAEQLIERDVLDQLFAARLVHHNAAVVGVFPPLLADYLCREGTAFSPARTPADTPPETTLPETPGPDTVLPWIASDAIVRALGADAAVRNQRMAARSAADIARLRREWRADPTPERAMPLLVALRAAARPAREIEYVVSATPAEDSFADARMRSWFATWTAVGEDRLGDALAVLDEAAERLPAHRDFLEVTRAHVVFMRDRVPSLDGFADVPDTADTELLRVVRAEVLLATGKTGQAQKLLADFEPTGRVASDQASLLRALVAVFHGDPEDGAARARRGYQQALANGDPGLQQAYAYTAIIGLAIPGRLADAAQMLFDALSSSAVTSYRDVYHTGLLTLGAVTIARSQGRPGYTDSLIAQAAAAGAGRGPYIGMVAGRMRARLAGADIWPSVDDTIERGYLIAAIAAAVEAVEQDPDATRAAPVIGLRGAVEGRLLPALVDYIDAASAGDEPGLAAASEALRNTGALGWAIRADVTRCLLLRRLGRVADAAAVADETWCSSSLVADHPGLFARLRDDIGLSAREAEILSLISTQPTVVDVAQTLQTSIRTVESHLYNIGRKVGLSGREALARAAGTWLHTQQM